MVYNHLKDKVKSFLQPFAESGQAVGAEDIKAYFEKLRGDEQGIHAAVVSSGNGGGEGKGDGRREQRGKGTVFTVIVGACADHRTSRLLDWDEQISAHVRLGYGDNVVASSWSFEWTGSRWIGHAGSSSSFLAYRVALARILSHVDPASPSSGLVVCTHSHRFLLGK